MFEKIKERYLKNYVRDDQLDRYVELKVLTAEQAKEIREAKK
ncbi:MAG: XkdX family protein [Lachnospirales bacterium]